MKPDPDPGENNGSIPAGLKYNCWLLAEIELHPWFNVDTYHALARRTEPVHGPGSQHACSTHRTSWTRRSIYNHLTLSAAFSLDIDWQRKGRRETVVLLPYSSDKVPEEV